MRHPRRLTIKAVRVVGGKQTPAVLLSDQAVVPDDDGCIKLRIGTMDRPGQVNPKSEGMTRGPQRHRALDTHMDDRPQVVTIEDVLDKLLAANSSPVGNAE